MDHSKCGHMHTLVQLQEKKLRACSSDSHRGQGSLPLVGWHEAAAGLRKNEEPYAVTGTEGAAFFTAVGSSSADRRLSAGVPTANTAVAALLWGLTHHQTSRPTPAPPRLQPDVRRLSHHALKDLPLLNTTLPSF